MAQTPTQYVCTELVEIQGGVMFCKNWTPIHNQTFLDMIAITPKEMVQIGSSISGVLAIILAFVILAKASKQL